MLRTSLPICGFVFVDTISSNHIENKRKSAIFLQQFKYEHTAIKATGNVIREKEGEDRFQVFTAR